MQSPNFSQNYFELFGLEPVFEIDFSALQIAQQDLQASYHPDRFVGASEQEKRISVQMASWVNQAYDTLRDPVKRARYMLELSGADLPDDSATTSDTEFLMEQIELREQIEACREHEDALERSVQIEDRLAQRAQQLAKDFVERFSAGDMDGALSNSRKMQFIQRIQHQLSELQFELEDI